MELNQVIMKKLCYWEEFIKIYTENCSAFLFEVKKGIIFKLPPIPDPSVWMHCI
jgi:hypothetical protein